MACDGPLELIDQRSQIVAIGGNGVSPFGCLRLLTLGLRASAIVALLCSAQVTFAGYALIVQTDSRSVTRVDGQPAQIRIDSKTAASTSQGTESSSCRAYGRQSAASAVASAVRLARAKNSVSLALSATAISNGGHYRTCVSCLAQQCIGIEGHDTGSSAEASASASTLLKFDEVTLPGRYRLVLAISRSSAANSFSLDVLDIEGNSLSSESDGSYVVNGVPGAIYRVVAEAKSEASDKGGCCSKKDDAAFKLEISVDRLAEIGEAKVPFVIGGDDAPGYPEVGLLTIQKTDGAISPHCTGTLIGKRSVLTAAHCVADDYALAVTQKRMKFLLGKSINDSSAERFTITEALVPNAAPFVYKLVNLTVSQV